MSLLEHSQCECRSARGLGVLALLVPSAGSSHESLPGLCLTFQTQEARTSCQGGQVRAWTSLGAGWGQEMERPLSLSVASSVPFSAAAGAGVCAPAPPLLWGRLVLPAPDMSLLLLGLPLPTTTPSPAPFWAGTLLPEHPPQLTSPIPPQPQAPLPTLRPAPPAPRPPDLPLPLPTPQPPPLPRAGLRAQPRHLQVSDRLGILEPGQESCWRERCQSRERGACRANIYRASAGTGKQR